MGEHSEYNEKREKLIELLDERFKFGERTHGDGYKRATPAFHRDASEDDLDDFFHLIEAGMEDDGMEELADAVNFALFYAVTKHD